MRKDLGLLAQPALQLVHLAAELGHRAVELLPLAVAQRRGLLRGTLVRAEEQGRHPAEHGPHEDHEQQTDVDLQGFLRTSV